MDQTASLIFDNRDLHWNLTLAIPYTLILGESATGKTFLIKNLKQLLLALKIQNESIEKVFGFKEIIFFDSGSSLQDLSQIITTKGSLILIDDADFLRVRYPNLEDWLTAGYANRYIIFGRGIWDISLLRGSVGNLEFDKNTRTFTFVPKELK